MFRGRLLLIGSLLVLSACGSSVTQTYTVTSSFEETAANVDLFKATERVMTRRLAGADIKGGKVAIVPKDETTATMTVTVPASGASTVERITSEPFTFGIAIDHGLVKDPEGNDVTDWQPTGIDGSMLDWVRPVQSSSEIGVELMLNAKGRELLAAVFKANQGKDIGLFVRDLLVSKLKVNAPDPGEHIVIGGIPSEKIAGIFADDVNVGLNVTFTPSK